MSKEKATKVKETKSTEIWSVPAYSNNKLVGHTKVTVFKETEDNLAAVRAALTLGDVIDINRQRFTDAKNNLRRGVSIMATLRQLAKADPNIAKVSTLLIKRAQGIALSAEEAEFVKTYLKA